LAKDYDLGSDLESDCAVVVQLFEKMTDVEKLCHLLYGIYSFCLYDDKTKQLHVIRDRIGITPLYIGVGSDCLMISSELKGLTHPNIERVEQFPPGHWLTLDIGDSVDSLRQLCGKSLR
jgi:asparagine synthase (glutamine-hydrolysing)